eukprot:225450-Pleurochrysis_carterae.AAC.1
MGESGRAEEPTQSSDERVRESTTREKTFIAMHCNKALLKPAHCSLQAFRPDHLALCSQMHAAHLPKHLLN